MRLPYVQIAEKYVDVQSKVVARLLSIKRNEAIGMGALLFSFAIQATGSEDAPPDGVFLGDDAADIIEAGMDWDGVPGMAVSSFVRANVIEQVERGFRLRGMDRYREAWEKQKARKLGLEQYKTDPLLGPARSEHARKAASARWTKEHAHEMPMGMLSDAHGHAQNAPKTETETETETERRREREEKSAPPESQISDALKVYAHYRETFHRRQPEPNASQRDRILCALREGYNVQELKRAIEGLANSDWHRKRNFLSLDHVLKDRETIERCIAWAFSPPDIHEEKQRYDPNQGIMGSYS